VQDKYLHSPGRDASPRRPGVPAGRRCHKKNFVLRPGSGCRTDSASGRRDGGLSCSILLLGCPWRSRAESQMANLGLK
jgi:hypothetical protein